MVYFIDVIIVKIFCLKFKLFSLVILVVLKFFIKKEFFYIFNIEFKSEGIIYIYIMLFKLRILLF